ncbi:MAG: XdhC family protein, partial [Lysinibacillus sp.]
GSKMLMTSSGKMVGSVSGGCLEPDLYGWAEKVFETGKPLIHDYDLSETEIWSLGIGCKGDLQFLFLPVLPNDFRWQQVQRLLQQQRSFSLMVNMYTGEIDVIDESETASAQNTFPVAVVQEAQRSFASQTRAKVMTFEKNKFFIDAVKKSERLIIAGAGQDALPVAELAYRSGFAVTIIDSRSHFNNEQRYPHATHIMNPLEIDLTELRNSWWVIMNHHQQKDEETLKLAIESQPKYIGVLGPMYRTTEMLGHIGYDMTSGPIYSPIGLDIGAETMDEVAISIISELMSLRAGRKGCSLHGRAKIHV